MAQAASQTTQAAYSQSSVAPGSVAADNAPQAIDPALTQAFFLAALLVAVAGAVLLQLRGLFPNDLTIAAGAMAMCGTIGLAKPSWRAAVRAEPRMSERLSAVAVFVLFWAFYSATRQRGPTPYYAHVLLAYSLLHGHAWVNAPGYMEQVHWHGHAYLLHPPLSAIVLMPFVAIWGLATDQISVCLTIGAIEVAIAWRLLGRLGLGASARVWLTLFLGVGSTLWYEATLGNSWDFALVVSVAPTLLALDEVFGPARPWRVGLWAGIAALGRYDLAMAWPAYLVLLGLRGRRWRQTLWALLPMAAAAAAYVAFNEVRFGTVNDIAMWLWYRHDGAGLHSHPNIPGPFSLRYLPINLYTLFFMAPALNTVFPYIHPQGMGQALVLTSPAFILALRPSIRRPIVIMLWIAAGASMAGALTVYANGYQQFGPRYSVQIYPFLFTLMALGVGRRADQLTKALILASIILVGYGTWHIRMLGFG